MSWSVCDLLTISIKFKKKYQLFQIEQLTKELNDLNEKAQLQYDLIGSLNRQIDLEKKLRLGNTFLEMY